MGAFVYGGLSYRDYLRVQSVEKSLTAVVSNETRQLIASNQELAESGVAAGAGIQTAVEDGFEAVTFELQGISAGIANLALAIQWGFTEVLTAVGRVNDSLEELIAIAKTPAQTWAFEQFEIARDAYRRQLYPEALEALHRAIGGHQSNTGYRIEYRFHFLLGVIRLGSRSNIDESIVDPAVAENSFLTAARYAVTDAPLEAARAYVAAGWAAYCQGKTDLAVAHTQQAIVLDGHSAEAHFQFAKLLMHCDRTEVALEALGLAIERDRMYAIKAAADGDFHRHGKALQAFLEALTKVARACATKSINELRSSIDAAEAAHGWGFTFSSYANCDLARSILSEAEAGMAEGSYFYYLDTPNRCSKGVLSTKGARERFRSAVQKELDSDLTTVRRRAAKVSSIETTWIFGAWVLEIVVLVVSIAIGQETWSRYPGAPRWAPLDSWSFLSSLSSGEKGLLVFMFGSITVWFLHVVGSSLHAGPLKRSLLRDEEELVRMKAAIDRLVDHPK